jgi:hypothetical protein
LELEQFFFNYDCMTAGFSTCRNFSKCCNGKYNLPVRPKIYLADAAIVSSILLKGKTQLLEIPVLLICYWLGRSEVERSTTFDK